MATLSPMAMTSVMRLSASFALRGLARAGAAAAQRSKGAMASSSAMATSNAASMTPSLHRLFASLLALPGTALCYSGVTFVPVTASDPEYSFKVRRREERECFFFFAFFWLDQRRNQPDQTENEVISTVVSQPFSSSFFPPRPIKTGLRRRRLTRVAAEAPGGPCLVQDLLEIVSVVGF